MHSTVCLVPREVDVFHAVFACGQNSRMNLQRFEKDITIHWDPVHDKSWQAVLQTIVTLRPRFSVLENTMGLWFLSCKSAKVSRVGSISKVGMLPLLWCRLRAGGENNAPALQTNLQQLRSVPGVSVGVAQLSAHPLPTSRERLIIYASCDSAVTGESLAKECESLAAKVKEAFPQHHLSTVFKGSAGDRAAPRLLTAEEEAADKRDYYKYFSSAVDKAFRKNRLPSDLSLPMMEDRPSFRHEALAGKSP